MSKPTVLAPHPGIETLHNEGVSLLKDDPIGAQNKLRIAAERTPGAYAGNIAARNVHLARLHRDTGQAILRQAIRNPNSVELSDIHHELYISTSILEEVAETTPPLLRGDRRYLTAERGATATWEARAALGLRAVGAETPDLDAVADKFREAHQFLRKGSDRYYATSNSGHAARFEAWRGNHKEAAKWLGRGCLSVMCAAIQRDRFMGSLRTFARLGRDIAQKDRRKYLPHIISEGGV